MNAKKKKWNEQMEGKGMRIFCSPQYLYCWFYDKSKQFAVQLSVNYYYFLFRWIIYYCVFLNEIETYSFIFEHSFCCCLCTYICIIFFHSNIWYNAKEGEHNMRFSFHFLFSVSFRFKSCFVLLFSTILGIQHQTHAFVFLVIFK